MKYIEKDLPIEKLNLVALKEGNSKRPIYRMHKWWARRLGSVFRTLILAAFADEGEPPSSLWEKFYRGTDLAGKVVLDPFCGGGTTLVEALRLGCKVIGSDVNPVAWFVTKKEIEPVTLKELEEAFQSLNESVGARIRSYYKTSCPNSHEAEAMYFFWIKTTICENCEKEVRLFPSYEIVHKDGTTTVFCPNCSKIFVGPRINKNQSCPSCSLIFDPTKGPAIGGGKFSCSNCGHMANILDAVRRSKRPLELELFALEYYCEVCGRGYKPADERDINLFGKAKLDFETRKESLPFPRQKIPVEGRSDPRPVNHGYAHFYQMFNERQLLCLSLLLEEIMKVEDQNIKELLLIAFSDSLDANNMFCKYEVDYQKISLLFGLHAYHPIERPAENNVWGTRFGRGTFEKCYEKVKRAKLYLEAPFEMDYKSRNGGHIPTNERVSGSLAKDFADFKNSRKNALLLCRDSRDMSVIKDEAVDAVITDPPYFDNVMYSELSDFFYVWLRVALKDTYSWFEPELLRRDVEIVQNPKVSNTIASFAGGFTAVLRECHRVLKPDGVLVFTFHHKQPWAWQELGQILLDGGFYISGSPIVRSEGKSGFHSSAGNIKYDAVIVCRKRPIDVELADWEMLKPSIQKESEIWLKRLLASDMKVNEVDVFTLTMAKLLASYTKYWPRVVCQEKEFDLGQAVKEGHQIYKEVIRKLLTGTPYSIQPKQGVFVFEHKAKWNP